MMIIVFRHKVVLMSAIQYFRATFANFSENKKDIVDIRKIDFTVLNNILVDYNYSGKIMIRKENVQFLKVAKCNVLQLGYVKGACAKILQKQLNPTHCLYTRSSADLST
uniref:ACYPI52845 protein n=1 Tax=Acyrthosiphon pisum TaxID=7029 RepID=C4WWC3_ACYPI|nr:ACYPI52845 [Acyrthosiphon pisum]